MAPEKAWNFSRSVFLTVVDCVRLKLECEEQLALFFPFFSIS